MTAGGGWPALAAASIARGLGLLGRRYPGCAVCGKPAVEQGRLAMRDEALSLRGRASLARLAAVLCPACLQAVPWMGRIACRICGRDAACPDCVRRDAASFIYNRSAVRYDGAMKEWLALYKFRGQERLETVLAAMMAPAYERLTEEARRFRSVRQAPAVAQAASARRFAWPRRDRRLWDAVTYVPISRERAEERGFNQSERLAQLIASQYGLPVYSLLRRTRHTGKQSQKGRAARMRDTRALFAPDEAGWQAFARPCAGRRTTGARPAVLLIDDIYTTGSTVDACAGTLLRAAGGRADIFALTWARS